MNKALFARAKKYSIRRDGINKGDVRLFITQRPIAVHDEGTDQASRYQTAIHAWAEQESGLQVDDQLTIGDRDMQVAETHLNSTHEDENDGVYLVVLVEC